MYLLKFSGAEWSLRDLSIYKILKLKNFTKMKKGLMDSGVVQNATYLMSFL